MFKKTLLATAVVGLMSTSAVYAADQDARFYVSGHVGGAIVANVMDTAENEASSSDTAKLEAKYNTGVNGLAALGYMFNNNFGAELQTGFMHANMNKMESANTEVSTSGSLNAIPVMVNGYWHFSNLSDTLVPYVGVGAGYASVQAKFNNVGTTNTDNNTTTGTMAYQGIVGLGYNLSDNATLGAEYRYFSTTNADFKYTNASTNYKANSKLQESMFNVGFTWRFDA